MADPEKSGWARWVESDIKRDLTPFQARAVDVLCAAFGAPWNAPWIWRRADWHWGGGIAVCARTTPSTYDFDHLTRLVIAAHDACVRAEISPASSAHIRIALHARKRDGSRYARHPTMEEAIARFRGTEAAT